MWIAKSFASDFPIENITITLLMASSTIAVSALMTSITATINDAKIEKWINTLCSRDSTFALVTIGTHINLGVIRIQMWLWACVGSMDVLGVCCSMRWCERLLSGIYVLGWRFQSYLNDRQLNVNYMKNDFLISRPSRNSIQFDKTFGLCIRVFVLVLVLVHASEIRSCFFSLKVLINWR